MNAIDTNLVVRVLTGDDPQQAQAATKAISRGVFVSSGVLIETEWVMRSVFGWPRPRIAAGLRRLLREENVVTLNAERIGWAIERYSIGADWADMIHLADAAQYEAFVTFDRRVPADAGEDSPVPVVLLA